MHLYQGRAYNDDRVFILDLALTEKDTRTFWVVITRRNHEGFPPFKVDKFRSKEEALSFIRKIEPTTPRISLGGTSPEKPLSYQEYCDKLKELNIPSAIEIYEHNKDVKREIIVEDLKDEDVSGATESDIL